MPDFCLIDAINPLEGDGPGRSGKEIKGFNLIVIGKNMNDVDAVGCRIMGIDPEKVSHLSKAKAEITVIGDKIENVKRIFVLPKGYFEKYNLRFWITDKTCSGCSEILGMLKRSIFKNPIVIGKFIYYAIFKEVDIISGGGELKKPSKNSKIIYLGDCMRKKINYNKANFVGGCPPAYESFLSVLRKM